MIGSEYKQELAEEQIKAMKMEASYYREYKKKNNYFEGEERPIRVDRREVDSKASVNSGKLEYFLLIMEISL